MWYLCTSLTFQSHTTVSTAKNVLFELFQAVAIWSAIKEYVTQIMEENETFQKDDHCLRFIRHLSSQIVNKENPDLIKTSLPSFSKALLQTGLQYLEGGYDNVPCVKAVEAMGTYSKEIGAWISKVLAINPKDEEIIIGITIF